MNSKLTALDFFAGSGLVTEGLIQHFEVVWANDFDPKKAIIYKANFPDHVFEGRSITEVKGSSLPSVDLAWGSFPCQDLSLAGNLKGMVKGTRSSLFYEWLRVLDEMDSRPPVLCAENVVGFLVADDSRHFVEAYTAIKDRGYLAGALILDAINFVPQSRPRCFLVAIDRSIDTTRWIEDSPDYKKLPKALVRAHNKVKDTDWLWWKLPPLPQRESTFHSICDFSAPVDPPEKTQKLLDLLYERDFEFLEEAVKLGVTIVAAGYKRTRPNGNGVGVQRLELRYDEVAGCLRTPNGGSSRQNVVIVRNGKLSTRLLTIKETARLMGVRDSYKLPGTYNDAYRAMGDAVAVPVTRWLSKSLLAPLGRKAREREYDETNSKKQVRAVL